MVGDGESRERDFDELGVRGTGRWGWDIAVVLEVEEQGILVVGVHVVNDASANGVVQGRGGGSVDVWGGSGGARARRAGAGGAGAGGCHFAGVLVSRKSELRQGVIVMGVGGEIRLECR